MCAEEGRLTGVRVAGGFVGGGQPRAQVRGRARGHLQRALPPPPPARRRRRRRRCTQCRPLVCPSCSARSWMRARAYLRAFWGCACRQGLGSMRGRGLEAPLYLPHQACAAPGHAPPRHAWAAVPHVAARSARWCARLLALRRWRRDRGSRGRVERTLHRETAVVCGAALASLASLRGDWWLGLSGAGSSDGWGEAGVGPHDIPLLPCQRTPPGSQGGTPGCGEGAGRRAVWSLDLDAVKACMARKRESAFAPSVTPKKGGADDNSAHVQGAGGTARGSQTCAKGGRQVRVGGLSPGGGEGSLSPQAQETKRHSARSKGGRNGIEPKRDARFRDAAHRPVVGGCQPSGGAGDVGGRGGDGTSDKT